MEDEPVRFPTIERRGLPITAVRRVRISRLAPTGEGISRGADGVGFVAGALPGEEVEARVEEVRRTYWRGRAVDVVTPSPDRVCPPADTCPGCDWGHFAPDPARGAKRDLFLETMQRIAKLGPERFGELPVVRSPLEYRIRNRFHVAGRGPDLAIGQFAPRTHEVRSVTRCRALTKETAALLPALRDALGATGVALSELRTLEDLPGARRIARATLALSRRGARAAAESVAAALEPWFAGVRVVAADGRLVTETGIGRLPIDVGARTFLVSSETFFQGNRHLVGRLLRDVATASGEGGGEALDAFGGVGLFASALLDRGHSVVSVEGSASAARDAAKTRLGWPDAERWRIMPSSVGGFLSSSPRRFDVVVADPPRAGLGNLARPLAERARRGFVYVSCDPPTLARDLPVLVAQGLALESAALYDLFPLTHRVEAVVTLRRPP